MAFILSDKWAEEVCANYGIDPRVVKRVIVDAKAGEVLRVYFDTFGDDTSLRFVPTDAHGAKVFVDGKEQ